MNEQERANAEFEFVRRTFFPRWDRKRVWKFMVVDDADGAQGKSISRTKTVKIVPTDADSLKLLLIHEISHAVASNAHGDQWKARMEKAAQQAESEALTDLAAQIRDEIEAYTDPLRHVKVKITAKTIYQDIKDIACFDGPELSFDQVIDAVRREYGISREIFLQSYQRCRRVFDEAKKELTDHEQRVKRAQDIKQRRERP